MSEFVSFTLGGISFGMVYAAIGLSLVLIWRATRILNFAQGAMAMLTTFIALVIIHATGSYWAGFAGALAAGRFPRSPLEPVGGQPAVGTPTVQPGHPSSGPLGSPVV